MDPVPTREMLEKTTRERAARAAAIASAGGLDQAISAGTVPQVADLSVSEALVLGLLRLGVRDYLCVLGHGSTDLGEVLRAYEQAGVTSTYGVRHETAAAHAATALRWVTGRRAAVVTSIGPGALHALAGSLAAATDGLGVWHIYGDETTEDEGPNMQQVPKAEQGLFHRLCATIGGAYSLHTPAALGPALRRGADVVEHPYRAGPFFMLLPLNVQPAVMAGFNLAELPAGGPPPLGAASDEDGAYRRAASSLMAAGRVVVKVGGGARACRAELDALLDLADAVAVTSPIVSGLLPYHHPRNMTVGGSKGSISGNYAMGNADLLLAVGTRAVCQSDCSRTGYPRVGQVINVNASVEAAMHYQHTLPLVGDAKATLSRLVGELRSLASTREDLVGSLEPSGWLAQCQAAKREWDRFKAERIDKARLHDPVWGKAVLTQPATIKAITDLARSRGAVCFFDAGDVQANGFQVVEDDRLGQTITETGASYMGFAVSALLATAIGPPVERFRGVAITGDGSFTMNPQILIDGVHHGVTGTIVVLDNRRMGAISSLQVSQYGDGNDHATSDHVRVDYLAWARAVEGVESFAGGDTIQELQHALDQAMAYDGLSVVHVPVYWGDDPLGGLGAWGPWNVGSWVDRTQALRHEIAL